MLDPTHVYILTGRYRDHDVSDQLFELKAPWKNTGNRKYVRVYTNGYLESLATTTGTTCQIMCEDGDFRYTDADGNEMEFSTSSTSSPAAGWESKYRSEETEDEALVRIRESFDVLTRMTQKCKEGKIRSLIVSGAPGIGKSYDVEQVLRGHRRDLEDDPRYEVIKGVLTPLMLFQKLFHHRGKDHVLVLDDCDKVFKSEDSANILKAVLDTTKRRTVQWLSSRSDLEVAGVDQKFDFNGSIIFMTNVNFSNLRSDTDIGLHLNALKDRCMVMDLNLHVLSDMMLRIKQIMADGLLRKFNFTPAEELEIYDFMKDNLYNLQNVSLRAVLKIATLKEAFPEKWRMVASQTVMTQEAYYRLLMERRELQFEE
jgi:hypothetical protein